jgi:hypothetical protein
VRILAKAITTAFCAASLAGCYTVQVNMSDLDSSETEAKEVVVKSFKIEVKHHHAVVGLATLGDPDIQNLIQKEVIRAGGKRARIIRLTNQQTFIDGLIGFLTQNLYRPSTSWVEGVVVR